MNGNGTEAAAAADTIPFDDDSQEVDEIADTGAPAPFAPFAPEATGQMFALVGSSPTVARLFGALARAQAKIEPAKKDSENVGFSRNGKSARYADLAAVIEAARPHLSAVGLCVMQIPTVSPKGQQVLSTILGHESGEWIECQYPIRPMRRKGKEEGGEWIDSHDPQSIGSAFTYARRYSYQGLVGVTAEEDDDGNAASGRGVDAGPRASDFGCPSCGKFGTIRPSSYGGHYCNAKAGGCNAKFPDGDPREAMAAAKRAELAKDAPDATKPAAAPAPSARPAQRLPATAAPDAVTGSPATDAVIAGLSAPANPSLDAALEKTKQTPTPTQIARAEAKTLTGHLAELDRVEDVNDAVKALAASAEYKACSAETKAEIMAEVGRIRTRLGKGR